MLNAPQCHINKHTTRNQSDARQYEHITCIHIHAKPFGIERLVQYTKCQERILYALHDDLPLIVQFVYIFKIRISGAGEAVGGTGSSCLNRRGQRSEGLLPRSPGRGRSHLLLQFTKTDAMRLFSIDNHCGALSYIEKYFTFFGCKICIYCITNRRKTRYRRNQHMHTVNIYRT